MNLQTFNLAEEYLAEIHRIEIEIERRDEIIEGKVTIPIDLASHQSFYSMRMTDNMVEKLRSHLIKLAIEEKYKLIAEKEELQKKFDML